MSPSLKATLISALVFPGGGHFYLKRHVVGTLLAGISLICVYLLVSTALEAAEVISQKIVSGEIPLDIARIRAEIYKQTAASATTATEAATWLLGVCWLVGIVDSFRLGRTSQRPGVDSQEVDT